MISYSKCVQVTIHFWFAECPSFITNGENLLNKVTSLNDGHIFNTTHLWCTCATTPQNISLNFTELVHLTQLRMRGSPLSLKTLVGENRTVHLNINGIGVSILASTYICS